MNSDPRCEKPTACEKTGKRGALCNRCSRRIHIAKINQKDWTEAKRQRMIRLNNDPNFDNGKKTLSPKAIDDILCRLRANWPHSDLALTHHVSPDWIGRLARREGLFRHPNNTKIARTRFFLAMPEVLEDLLNEDLSFTDIAAKWGVSLTKISKLAKTVGLQRSPSRASRENP